MEQSESEQYSVVDSAKELFQRGILHNSLLQKYLPRGFADASEHVKFEGSAGPTLPINWRFAESISVLKAYEATLLNLLLKLKYKTNPVGISVNTDHAQLFLMSWLLWEIDPKGEALSAAAAVRPENQHKLAAIFPDCDKYRSAGNPYRTAATNIYQCKDGRFFHIHAGMNPNILLERLNLPSSSDVDSFEASLSPFQKVVGNLSSQDMQNLVDGIGQAGTICWSAEEYRNSTQGKANANVSLFEIFPKPYRNQQPCWWESSKPATPKRPLEGLKVVDLTRVIAAPVITRGLAEMGASVMRVTASHLPDVSFLHPDTNHGKWNTFLDLREEKDREQLKELILQADVVVQGYQPFALDKHGFSQEAILDMCASRQRGIIYVRVNSYGWHGPWASRAGWQQISDANCGTSMEFGKAMGNAEPVTPILPNSDYCTGVIGTVAVLTALLQRAEEGGSFTIDVALDYYSRWLIDYVGTYPESVWLNLRKKNGNPSFRHHHHMTYTIPRVFGGLMTSTESRSRLLGQPKFFTQYKVKNLDKDIRIVAPILTFPGQEVELGFKVGTRTNGVDLPKWPKDLDVEIVA